jgi:hypothetical protein
MKKTRLKLVRMARKSNSTKPRTVKPRGKAIGRTGYCILQAAKARRSELVRGARSDAPEYVTVRGREGVVAVANEEFRRLRGEVTGAALESAMRGTPHRGLLLEPKGVPMPIRDVDLP